MSPDGADGVRWPSRAGAWLGIGTSPAALALGAGLAERHGGAVGVVGVAVGVILMAAMLYAQGLIGLVPPTGEGATLSGVADRYLGGWTLPALHLLLSLAMVGWFGFNVGLGGAALSAVTGVPAAAGPLLLGVPIVVVAAGGLRRWNALAVGTTLCALALVALVVARFAPPASPVAASASNWLADAGAFVGYVAVFGLRAPDFSHNLARRTDLRWCVGLLVGATGLVAIAGAALFLGTGTADVVGAITGGQGARLGNVLITVAVVAATFTTLYSGSLALRAITPAGPTTAMVAIATPGLALAVARFDRMLLPWLSVLGALLPPLLVPMAVEATRRRRGHEPRAVQVWTWAPAALIALVLTARGVGVSALVGIGVSAASTAIAVRFTRR
jgi:purine-cytosine permease-like protein